MRRRFLGLDLSMNSAGVAVIDLVDGALELRTAYRIKTNPKQRHGQRLNQIAYELRNTLREYEPFDTIVREKGFSRFAATTQALFKVVGVSDLVLRDYHIVELSPTTIKKIMTGSGKAGKEEVELAVRDVLGLGEDYIFISDDESDACAVILAYLLENGILEDKDHKTKGERKG
ncbi:crossover junction endodeoxyribonuclease RuvC [Bacillus thuringiensis]|uniref:crossover junction endodeoxyribonuclease RuvC n=1 Tax=Bacillus thuringiensis TaxID=1428 RepID=UPI0011128D92|nr:crossover junction endodeoxyribonuclease RuvC [Bacillus thuringiensis]QCY65025.1 crossover junction endodeoxyribonuclease RuvC [Bacillus thuringiensis]